MKSRSRSISFSDSNSDSYPKKYYAKDQFKESYMYKGEMILMSQKQAQILEDFVHETKGEAIEQEHLDIDAKKEEYKNTIQLNVFARQDNIQLQKQSQILPIVIQLESIKAQKTSIKANIDLICVVDVSGSMRDEKIQLVKNSLRYIQKILQPNDRIALVTFASQAYVNLPWTRNIAENKKKIKRAIKNMEIRDSTKIANGFNLGISMIKDRQYKNQITNLFLLSDGVDDDSDADQRCKKALLDCNLKDTFTINTFGYGKDHDPKVLNNISNLKEGQFFYVDNIQKVPERFILALSGMLSIKAQNVVLTIKQINEKFKITKIFGDDSFWEKTNNSDYKLNLNYIIDDDKKEYALEIEIPNEQHYQAQQAHVLSVELQGKLINLNTEFQKESKLLLTFTKQQVVVQPNELVEINYLRAKAGDIIGQAKEYANKREYDQAQQLLNKMINEIEESFFQNNIQLLLVIKDLKHIKSICLPQQYKNGGEALMIHKHKKHIKRQRSISNSEEWCENEEKYMSQFRNGHLELSESGSPDSRSRERLQSVSPPSHSSQQRGRKNYKRQNARNKNRNSDSGSLQRFKQRQRRRNSKSISQDRRRNSKSRSQDRRRNSKSRSQDRKGRSKRSNSHRKNCQRRRSRS